MSRKRLASQFAWVSIGRLAGALIQAVTMLLVARDLGPHDFGIFSAVFGSAIVFQAAFDLGIATMVVRDRAAERSNPFIHSALRVTDRVGWGIFGLTLVPLLVLGFTVDPFFLLLLPLSVWAACERHTDTWLSVPLADGDARINTQNLLIRRTVAILIYLGAVYVGINAALAFSAAMAITAVVSMVVIRKVVWSRIVPTDNPIPFKEIVRRSWPFWLNSLGTQARNLDTVLVSAIAGPSQAGFYAATSRATGPLRILSTSMAAVLLPASTAKSRASIHKLLRLVGLMALCCGVIYGGLILVVPLPWISFLAILIRRHTAASDRSRGTHICRGSIPIHIHTARPWFSAVRRQSGCRHDSTLPRPSIRRNHRSRCRGCGSCT